MSVYKSDPFARLQQRIDELEQKLELLLRKTQRHEEAVPVYLSWLKTAQLLGIDSSHCKDPGRAVRKRVERERSRPGGMQLRVRHGGVHREDFMRWLKAIEQRKPSRSRLILRDVSDLVR